MVTDLLEALGEGSVGSDSEPVHEGPDAFCLSRPRKWRHLVQVRRWVLEGTDPGRRPRVGHTGPTNPSPTSGGP